MGPASHKIRHLRAQPAPGSPSDHPPPHSPMTGANVRDRGALFLFLAAHPGLSRCDAALTDWRARFRVTPRRSVSGTWWAPAIRCRSGALTVTSSDRTPLSDRPSFGRFLRSVWRSQPLRLGAEKRSRETRRSRDLCSKTSRVSRPSRTARVSLHNGSVMRPAGRNGGAIASVPATAFWIAHERLPPLR